MTTGLEIWNKKLVEKLFKSVVLEKLETVYLDEDTCFDGLKGWYVTAGPYSTPKRHRTVIIGAFPTRPGEEKPEIVTIPPVKAFDKVLIHELPSLKRRIT